MAKIYISSTYEDLIKEREAAAQALRRLGHQPIAMEDYVAADKRPLDKCLDDVRSCDAYVGLFAWRYGFIQDRFDKSITHLEYEEARKAGIPALIFLLHEKAPWPVEYVSKGEERKKIDKLRDELKKGHIIRFFKNADELSGLVSSAVSNLKFSLSISSAPLRGKPILNPLTVLGDHALGDSQSSISPGPGVKTMAPHALGNRQSSIIKNIFISYSHKDAGWKDLLVSHLHVLEKQGLCQLWHDRDISLGWDWFPDIDTAINQAHLAVLLITKDFLDSDFIAKEEIPRFLKRRETGDLIVVPLFVKPCAWGLVDWLQGIQGFPPNGPLAKLKEADKTCIEDETGHIAARSLLKRVDVAGYPDDKHWPVDFCHRSMREYFVARAVCNMVEKDPEDAGEFLTGSFLSHEIISFAGEIMKNKYREKGYDYEKNLLKLIEKTRNVENIKRMDLKHLGGNAVNLLYQYKGFLPGKDWSNLVLDGAILPEADLSGENFSYTSLP